MKLISTKVQIADATDEELRNFAQLALGLPVEDLGSRPALLAAISSAYMQDFITVQRAAPEENEQTQEGAPSVAPQQKLVGKAGGHGEPVVILKIGQTEMPGGKDPVPVAVNGQTLIIQRNLRAEVPYRFYEALKNAVRQVVEQQVDPVNARMRINVDSEVTNYPLQIEQLPSPEAVAEWKERTKDLEMA